MVAEIINGAVNDLGWGSPVIVMTFGGLLAITLAAISRGNRERAMASAGAPAARIEFVFPVRPVMPRIAARAPLPTTVAPSPRRVSPYRRIDADGSVWSLTADGDWIKIAGTGANDVAIPCDEAA